MQSIPPPEPQRRAILIILPVLIYVAISTFYAFRVERNMDEFGGAWQILSMRHETPYVDFCPPKTVLSYYVYTPAIALTANIWNALTAARLETVALAAAALLFAALSLRRHLTDTAVGASLLLLVLMSNYLERSTELRADAISTIFGLIAIGFLLRDRPGLAGLSVALAFLSTQKGIYFVFAGEASVLAVMVRDRTRQALRRALLYNAAGAATGAAYFAGWAALASPARLIACTFSSSARRIALGHTYSNMSNYWMQTLKQNPLIYVVAAVAVLTGVALWMRERGFNAVSVTIPFAAAQFALAAWHHEPFPYFFATLAPSLLAVNAIGIDRFLSMRKQRTVTVAAAALFAVFGIGLPLLNVARAQQHTNDYQHAIVNAAGQLLGPHDGYIDGVQMILDRRQPITDLAWIDLEQIRHLYSLSPAELTTLIHQIDAAQPKLLIWNYRMLALPPPLRSALEDRFLLLYGSIAIYAPTLRPGPFAIPFDGDYELRSAAIIDGRTIEAHSVVPLRKGAHVLEGNSTRLRLLPPRNMQVDPRFVAFRDPFDGIYSF